MLAIEFQVNTEGFMFKLSYKSLDDDEHVQVAVGIFLCSPAFNDFLSGQYSTQI